MRFSDHRSHLPFSPRIPLLLIGVLGAVAAAFAFWGATGHRIINLKAVMHLPSSMAAQKADSAFYQSHASDADNRKNYSDTSFYSEAERHYINFEDYPNWRTLTHNLDSAQLLYGRTNVHNRGTLPWATVMVVESLTVQFRRNDAAAARQTMADLGHYVGDAHQPLHCTANYDGYATGNNGIHSRYETSMIGTYQSQLVIVPDVAQYISNPLEYVFQYLYQSNSYTDSIMAADNYAKSVSGWNGSGSAPSLYYTALWSKTQTLTKERFQHATVALASLWYTAWVNSQVYVAPQYRLTASSTSHGTLVPSGIMDIDSGLTQRFTFAPETGYHLDSVIVDGLPVDSTEGYTFANLTSGHTLRIVFAIDRFIVTSSAGPNGSISPTGPVSVAYGGRQIYVISPDTGFEIDSVLVDETYSGNTSPDTIRLVYAPHSIRAVFKVGQAHLSLSVDQRWNLVSVPLDVASMAKSDLFPGSVSDAFAFNGTYVATPTLARGTGYWLKFGSAALIAVAGDDIVTDTISLMPGWNLIGVPGHQVQVSGITTLTDGLELSDFFGYSSGYFSASVLVPGRGYWVKASQSGAIVLTGN